VSGVLNDGFALSFQFRDQRGEGGGAFTAVAQQLGDVEQLVWFVVDDGFQFLGRVLVPFDYVDRLLLSRSSYALARPRSQANVNSGRFENLSRPDATRHPRGRG
jgi:hypothetical protein